ncbi:MAG TPA: PQQ-binding-like beta-propeller repeat protein, partial [Candidatus Aminicenantes bacterium]|nr:PQQ-binding-like beta-propeller repeat protein [Candidatus Aminicenantes bacterium]
MSQPTVTRHSLQFRLSRPLGLLAAVLLTTAAAAAQSQPLLPEFTQAMAATPIFTWPHQAIVLTPLNGTGWVAGSEPGGQIALFSPLDGSARLSLFPGGVDRVLAIGGFRLLISSGSEWTLLDADTGQPHPSGPRLPQGQVLGGGEGLVLLDRGTALALVAPETGEVLGEIDKTGSEPATPWFGPAEVIVPLGDRLAFFDRQKRTWRKRPLPAQVTSGILVTDDCVYVGLAPRTLACIERESGIVRWRRPLVQPLRDTPLAVGEWIAVFPEDHNLYFFKAQGTLHWWAPLRALPRFLPVATRETVVVSALDGPLHLFDPKRKLALSWIPPAPLAAAAAFVAAPPAPPPPAGGPAAP